MLKFISPLVPVPISVLCLFLKYSIVFHHLKKKCFSKKKKKKKVVPVYKPLKPAMPQLILIRIIQNRFYLSLIYKWRN